MKRKKLNLKLQNKITCSEIRKRTKIIGFIEYTLNQKWRWAGHIARMKDNRWTKPCTEWQPRRGKRSRGRPSRRWEDDMARKGGTTWNKIYCAQKETHIFNVAVSNELFDRNTPHIA